MQNFRETNIDKYFLWRKNWRWGYSPQIYTGFISGREYEAQILCSWKLENLHNFLVRLVGLNVYNYTIVIYHNIRTSLRTNDKWSQNNKHFRNRYQISEIIRNKITFQKWRTSWTFAPTSIIWTWNFLYLLSTLPRKKHRILYRNQHFFEVQHICSKIHHRHRTFWES